MTDSTVLRVAITVLQAAAAWTYDAECTRPVAVQQAREALGLKQTELSSQLGYSHETVCRWENGRAAVPLVAILAVEALVWRALVERT